MLVAGTRLFVSEQAAQTADGTACGQDAQPGWMWPPQPAELL